MILDEQAPIRSFRLVTLSHVSSLLRNGQHLVLLFASVIILATWAVVGLHVSAQRNNLFGSADKELRGAVETLRAHIHRTIEAISITLYATDAWLHTAPSHADDPPSLDALGAL